MEKNQDVKIEMKIGRPKTVTEDNKKKSINIYLKRDLYNKVMDIHNSTYAPISKIVELALQKELG